jgi:hypothetical protein
VFGGVVSNGSTKTKGNGVGVGGAVVVASVVVVIDAVVVVGSPVEGVVASDVEGPASQALNIIRSNMELISRLNDFFKLFNGFFTIITSISTLHCELPWFDLHQTSNQV